VSNDKEFESRVEALIDTLSLLTAQAQTYERVLPPENYQARIAIALLEKLAQQALNEARDLAAHLELTPKTSAPLSARESEVLKLVSEGLTNKEIAYRLGLSERTIQFHLNSIFNKTGTSSRTEAVVVAMKQGWF
jgi:DNA-binding NarL/FixJ family response regulator